MTKNVFKIESELLNRETEIHVYGHYGLSVLLFPSISDKIIENEEKGIIDSILPFIKNGKIKVFAIEGILNSSWLDKNIDPKSSSDRLYEYNEFINQEVIPFIYDRCGGPAPLITCGAANGGYLAANTYFRRPDVFLGTVAVDARYDIRDYTKVYFDQNCYFNSPVDYIPNMDDDYWLTYLKSRKHVYLVSGKGNSCNPASTEIVSQILNNKAIKHTMDLWSEEYNLDHNSWRKIIPHYFSTRL